MNSHQAVLSFALSNSSKYDSSVSNDSLLYVSQVSYIISSPEKELMTQLTGFSNACPTRERTI